MRSIEQRCAERDTTAFVVRETVDPLGQNMIGIIGDRRMTMMRRYLGDAGGVPELTPGLRVWHGGYGNAVTSGAGQFAKVQLCNARRTHEDIGFSVLCGDETERQAFDRYHTPDKRWGDERRNLTRVVLDGCPGEPSRGDSIRVERWNEHGVGIEAIIAFDDVEPVQELAWDINGNLERRVRLDEEWCTLHDVHFEDPVHEYGGACVPRTATLAENLRVLAQFAEKNQPST